jgi:hypothetical protein
MCLKSLEWVTSISLLYRSLVSLPIMLNNQGKLTYHHQLSPEIVGRQNRTEDTEHRERRIFPLIPFIVPF